MAYQQVSTMTGCARRYTGLLLLVLACLGNLAVAADAEIRANSPSSYTVAHGDTLWDIAGTFLEDPWLWPQVWQINPQIDNPDLIYPGDIIELAYDENGAPVLRLRRGDTAQTAIASSGTATVSSSSEGLRSIRLSPELRREAVLSPIPAIPLERISAFLSDDSVITQQHFDTAPYLLADTEGHTILAPGDDVFARGNWGSQVITYDIVRRGRDLVDPDTGEQIGVEALKIGSVILTSVNGDRGIMRVTQSSQEINAGDRLIPSQAQLIESRYLPMPPDFEVDAAIISIGTGRELGGLYDSLLINVGSGQGIKPGQLLAVREAPEIVRDIHGKLTVLQRFKRAIGKDAGDRLEFPGATVASVLVYRVFQDTSLVLVLRSGDAIRVNDRVVTP